MRMVGRNMDKQLEDYVRDDSYLQGIKDCLPTLFGYISIGFAFGVVGVASGLHVLEVFLLSVFVYAGSAQFIFCSLYVVGAPATAIIITVFIVNLRHLLMSFSLAPYFTRYSILRNIGFGTLLTDETFGVAVVKGAKENKLGGKWMDGLNVTAYFVWIVSCTVGGIFSQYIPDPERFGLDYALVAMFIALLVLTIHHLPKSKVTHYLKLIGYVAISMYVLTIFLSGHVAVLLSTIIVATIGVMTEK